MYTPAAFRIDDLHTLHAFVRQHSFATLVTAAAEPFVTHLPLLLDAERGPYGTLVGHFAKPNNHWQMDHVTQQSVAIFHGPHAYISPSWYRAGTTAVPTWNYAAVHAHGRLVILPDPQATAILLQRMVETYEGSRGLPWKNLLPPEVNEKLIHSVVAFEMPIERLEGKFKLGQNRVAADQIGAIEGLEESGDDDSLKLAAFTRQHLGLMAPNRGVANDP
jgi:transcriptional regulator